MSQAQITKKQRELTTTRVEEENISRNMEPSKLGGETYAVIPGQELDILVMFVSQQALAQLENSVRTKNRLTGLINSYGIPQDSDQVKELETYAELFESDFDKTKKTCEKVVAQHPLATDICKIKGMSFYQLGLIMGMIRYPERFGTFSQLATWAGVACKYGHHVSKRNINIINQHKHEEYTGNEEEFTKFGYKTTLQQRLYIIAESLMKQKGWFYNFYKNQRIRLERQAVNDGRAVKIGERYYMSSVTLYKYETFGKFVAEEREGEKPIETFHARKNQSLDAWANSNARWRMCRTLLQFIYEEWMKLRGITPREPYVFEYLGHTSKITLQEVLNYEDRQKEEKALEKSRQGQRENETD